MNLLITAGNTQSPVDEVRCITNIFTGRTGARIAQEAVRRGHDVTFFTSHPEVFTAEGQRSDVEGGEESPRRLPPSLTRRANVQPYRTYDELHELMAKAIPGGSFDAIIHAAAVSDYSVAGVYAPRPGAIFDADSSKWSSVPAFTDAYAGKVKSTHAEVWLRLVPTEKLIDKIRTTWGFRGRLVKFKLEVGLSEAELLKLAEAARLHSAADLMVANTLAGMSNWAYVGAGEYQKVSREQLAGELLRRLEAFSVAPPV